jgi:hypothetical protein
VLGDAGGRIVPISTHEMALGMPRPFRSVRLPTVVRVFLEVGTRVKPQQIDAASLARQALTQQLKLPLYSTD